MASFEYYGKTTENIINTPLILVSEGITDSALGVQRTIIQSDITASNYIVNEYGVMPDHLSFTYSLIKSDGEPFTNEEQIQVERWLTSPKFSSELKIIDCNNEECLYYGMFTNTEWIIGNGAFAMCLFTFQVNGCYAYKRYTVSKSAATYNNNTIVSVASEFDFPVYCNSDELEEYIYPNIKISPVSQGSGYTSSFTFKNITDSNNSIEVSTTISQPIYIDSRHCIIKKIVNNVNSDVKYSDIGWDNMGKIYWPRLIPGNNNIHITGRVNIEMEYISPYKKVGGWLI